MWHKQYQKNCDHNSTTQALKSQLFDCSKFAAPSQAMTDSSWSWFLWKLRIEFFIDIWSQICSNSMKIFIMGGYKQVPIIRKNFQAKIWRFKIQISKSSWEQSWSASPPVLWSWRLSWWTATTSIMIMKVQKFNILYWRPQLLLSWRIFFGLVMYNK